MSCVLLTFFVVVLLMLGLNDCAREVFAEGGGESGMNTRVGELCVCVCVCVLNVFCFNSIDVGFRRFYMGGVC